jgi:hypothetical protein
MRSLLLRHSELSAIVSKSRTFRNCLVEKIKEYDEARTDAEAKHKLFSEQRNEVLQ